MPLDDTKIIVIEDDDFMRQMVIDTLKFNGVSDENLRSFANAIEARAYFQERTVMDAVVICDIAMPTLNGLELYKEISPQLPGLKFIFVTALEFILSEERFLKEAGLPLLYKPFSSEDLLAAIEEISE